MSNRGEVYYTSMYISNSIQFKRLFHLLLLHEAILVIVRRRKS